MTITREDSDDKITLKVSGRVDTVTSKDLQQEMLKAFATGNILVMDFKDVEYVSSAGLRVFLMAEKTAKSKGGSFTLTNANESVISVLKTVGLDSVLNIL